MYDVLLGKCFIGGSFSWNRQTSWNKCIPLCIFRCPRYRIILIFLTSLTVAFPFNYKHWSYTTVNLFEYTNSACSKCRSHREPDDSFEGFGELSAEDTFEIKQCPLFSECKLNEWVTHNDTSFTLIFSFRCCSANTRNPQQMYTLHCIIFMSMSGVNDNYIIFILKLNKQWLTIAIHVPQWFRNLFNIQQKWRII